MSGATPASLKGSVAPKPPKPLAPAHMAQAEVTSILLVEFGRAPGVVVERLVKAVRDTEMPIVPAGYYDQNTVNRAALEAGKTVRKALLEQLEVVLHELFSNQEEEDPAKVDRWVKTMLTKVGG